MKLIIYYSIRLPGPYYYMPALCHYNICLGIYVMYAAMHISTMHCEDETMRFNMSCNNGVAGWIIVHSSS